MLFTHFTKVLLLALLLIFSIDCYAQKIKVEDIIAKHLNSIGSGQARSSIKNQIAVGNVAVKFISQGNSPILGRIVLASEGEKSFLGMSLSSAEYPSEKLTYDGTKGKIGTVKLGARSLLGNFIQSNKYILEDGLLGGVLSHGWFLHNYTNKKVKLSYNGTKNINGKDAFAVSYTSKGVSDVNTTLYFDKETFRHVRTEYKRVASAGIGSNPEESSKLNESRIKLEENFSDFRTVNGLTLPHSYSILYSITGQRGTTEMEWNSELREFAFNQNLASNTFVGEEN